MTALTRIRGMDWTPLRRETPVSRGATEHLSTRIIARAVLVAVLAGSLLAGRSAWIVRGAVLFSVTSAADRTDTNPGDGACDTGDGACTLRAAIMEADALGGTPDAPITINLPAGMYPLPIPPLPKPARNGFDDEADKGDLNIRRMSPPSAPVRTPQSLMATVRPRGGGNGHGVFLKQVRPLAREQEHMAIYAPSPTARSGQWGRIIPCRLRQPPP